MRAGLILTLSAHQSWHLRSGDVLLLSGKPIDRQRRSPQTHTGYASHAESSLPVSFKGRFIYYVGPADPVEGEVAGPAGRRPPRAWINLYPHDDCKIRAIDRHGG